MPLCRHDVPFIASQLSHLQAGSRTLHHRQFREGEIGNSEMHHGQPPLSLRALTSRALQLIVTQPTDKSLPHPIAVLASLTFIPSLPSVAPSEQEKCGTGLGLHRQDVIFCTAVSGDSYIQLISIPTTALS